MARYIREIRVKDLYLYFLLPLLILLLLGAALTLAIIFAEGILKYVFIAAIAVALYFDLKYLLIGSVLMYKAFAPMEVRDRCRFEPSCSTYMIMAVRKYGLFRGLFKGIRRITRCREPNGGIDLP
ncbi:MAG: membrane protein insertion efficiency factor YidD [Clostridia bacterium]|nr:membrane protein insertion efficiency factor YidD [Clostridia bacterium]